MAIVYELKSKSVCPPGGFVFRRKNGHKYEAVHVDEAIRECVRDHGLSEPEACQCVLRDTYENIVPSSRDYFITKNTEALICQNPTFRYVDRKLLFDAPYLYNPSLITVKGDDWLVYRRQTIQSDSDVCRMNFRTGENVAIALPSQHAGEQFEDPRVFWHDKAIHLMACSWRKSWAYKPLLRLFRLDKNWKVEKEIALDFGGNGQGITQKNWAFFSHEKKLHFVYQYAPFQVVENGNIFTGKRLNWNYGEIRGGTPPVKVGDSYFTFFHSRTELGRAKYHMGCLQFSAKEPFSPEAVTMEPLLSATNREPNLAWTPLCVFPCGSLFKNGRWTVSIGVNDVNCGLVDYDHEKLLALLKPA